VHFLFLTIQHTAKYFQENMLLALGNFTEIQAKSSSLHAIDIPLQQLANQLPLCKFNDPYCCCSNIRTLHPGTHQALKAGDLRNSLLEYDNTDYTAHQTLTSLFGPCSEISTSAHCMQKQQKKVLYMYKKKGRERERGGMAYIKGIIPCPVPAMAHSPLVK
jgi:hypothetical protein